MKILDKTPYRTATGVIDMAGRLQGSLKYGMSWYARIQAQDAAIAILDKVLGENCVLIRNATLPDTEIDLPLVLVCPQGIFLINVTHERGVYRAKDDEWGTVRSEKFVPAAINQVKRTLRMARVLQLYLEKAGLKDLPVIDPILMSADPGTHIESTRPAVRIIMSDALERFAISINQGRAILKADTIFKIVKTTLTGVEKKTESAESAAKTAQALPSSGGRDTTDALFASSEQQDANALGFSFDEEPAARQAPARPATQRQPGAQQSGAAQGAGSQYASYQSTGSQDGGGQNAGYQESAYPERDFQNTGFQDFGSQTGESGALDAQPFDAPRAESQAFDATQPDASLETESRPAAGAPKKKGLFGLTPRQLIILGALLLFWLCSVAVFFVYIIFFS